MIKKLLFVIGIFFSFTIGFSQTTISVPFSEGFIGTYSGSNNSPVAYHLSSLGIHSVRFTQNSTTGQFVGATQGNDIPGNVILRDNNNVQHTIPGVINWRAPSGGNITTMVFLPADGTNVTIATNGANGSSSYIVQGLPANPYTAIGLTFNGSTLSFTDGGPVTGNAATSGLLNSLNTYLNSLPSLTINSVTVTEATGAQAVITVTLSAASSNSVTVDYTTANNTALNGVNYTTTSGTLTFASGTTTKTITVPIINNPGVDAGKTFYVNLSNPTNASIIGLSGSVTIMETSGNSLNVNDSVAKLQFRVAQNPVQNGTAVFEFSNATNGQASIFDATGKLVKTFSVKGSGKESVDVSSLTKGMYTVVLKTPSQVAITKMIVQ